MEQKTGFTIVELLIVVVVIAILATITIISFNGIQDRAKSARTDSDIATIKKKLEVYRTTNGENYPASASAALSHSDFTGLSGTVVSTTSQWGCGTSQGLTKDKYCLFSSTSGTSRYALWWWDNQNDIWRYYSKYTTGGEDTFTLGSGNEPDGIPN